MNKTFAVIAALVVATFANAEVVFNDIPSTLDTSYPSLGYQATSTQEFGNQITLGGTNRHLDAATLTLVNWAKQSDYVGYGDATGFDVAFTLNFYNTGSGPYVGSSLGSVTQTFHVAWRPEVWPTNGYAQNVTFDLTSMNLDAPDTFIYGLAFNTQTHGYNPTGTPGPYNSLNYGVIDTAPTVGTDDNPDDVYWNTSYGPFYADGGAAGVNIFRQDTNWTGYTPMIQVHAVPEPGSMVLLGLGALAALKRRKRKA